MSSVTKQTYPVLWLFIPRVRDISWIKALSSFERELGNLYSKTNKKQMNVNWRLRLVTNIPLDDSSSRKDLRRISIPFLFDGAMLALGNLLGVEVFPFFLEVSISKVIKIMPVITFVIALGNQLIRHSNPTYLMHLKLEQPSCLSRGRIF